MTLDQLVALILLILFAVLIAFFSGQIRRGSSPSLRFIAAFEAIKMLTAQAIEAGQKLHFSIGTGGLTNRTTTDSLAGLAVLDYISEQTVAAGVPPVVTVSDPAVTLLAQDQLRRARRLDYVSTPDTATEVRWISTDPAAYAAGVMGILETETFEGNVLVGHFGDEYLLIGELANRRTDITATVAGASVPSVLPYVYATAASGLWGEELFAAGAYLSKKPSHLGSLLAQDTVRWIVGLVILGSVILRVLGIVG